MLKALKTIEPDRGIYILLMKIDADFEISAKKFIGIPFKAGYYYYVGSAQKNLKSRVSRHLRRDKKVHWHIDHLTSKEETDIYELILFPGAPKELECRLAAEMMEMNGLRSAIQGFGNSDDRRSFTHLFYSGIKDYHSHLFSRYQSMALFIPSSSV